MVLLSRWASGVNPPIPGKQPEGARLLSLIRLLEKESSFALFQECVEILGRLVGACLRKGLLEDRAELAEQVLHAVSSRKRSRNVKSSTLAGVEDNKSGDASVIALGVNHVLQGLVRIFLLPPTVDRHLLIILASDYCTAASEYAQSFPSNSQCHIAEIELLASHSILPSLQTCVKTLIRYENRSQNGLYTIDDEEHATALIATLRACSSMIRLLGTRISRTSLDDLHSAAWQSLSFTNDGVQEAASILLATLPLQKNIADSWQIMWQDTVVSLHDAIHTVAPIVQDVPMPSSTAQSKIRPSLEAVVRAPSEESRGDSFLFLLTGLMSILRCLLGDRLCSLPTLVVRIPVTSTLDVIEMLLSFSSSAEAVYFGTRKRLRAESVDNGVINAITVVQIANTVKVLGLELLQSFIEALGGPVLLPFRTSIEKLAAVTVRTSCSSSVRSALDPASSIDTKNQRWLHSSISTRVAAIDVFQQYVLAFGVNGYSETNGAPPQGQELDRTITFIGGTLVEVLLDASLPRTSDWGSFLERCQLIEACARCLRACLLRGGEFLISSTRTLINSVIYTALQALVERTNPFIATSSVQVAFLSLGTAGASTGFCDGSASPLASVLKLAAQSGTCNRDADITVCTVEALSACAILSTSRVPALQVVSGQNESSSIASRILTPSLLLDRLEDARVEMYKREVESEKLGEIAKKAKLHDFQEASNGTHTKNQAQQVEPAGPNALATKQEETLPEPASLPATDKRASQPALDDTTVLPSSPVPTQSRRESSSFEKVAKLDEDDYDDDLPMIVDADPDEDDLE